MCCATPVATYLKVPTWTVAKKLTMAWRWCPSDQPLVNRTAIGPLKVTINGTATTKQYQHTASFAASLFAGPALTTLIDQQTLTCPVAIIKICTSLKRGHFYTSMGCIHCQLTLALLFSLTCDTFNFSIPQQTNCGNHEGAMSQDDTKLKMCSLKLLKFIASYKHKVTCLS